VWSCFSIEVIKGATMLTIPDVELSREALSALAKKYRSSFKEAQPFPHVQIHDFLPLELAEALANSFPAVGDINWRLAGPGDASHTNDPNVEKISTSNEALFPPLIRKVMHEFNSGIFLDFVQELTGYSNLAPDPWYHGCGLHSTGRGGRLMIHADASRHPNPKFQQIFNMIYYVTPGWQADWGGQLELWDEEAKACVKKITPEFNSVVIFFTGSKSFHGHPHPLTSPTGIRRNSMAVYYYTTDRVLDDSYEGYKNFVEWKKTNELDHRVSLFHQSKGLARRFLPATAVNALASGFRRVRRMVPKS
jgi:hypothetical protein